MQYLPASPNATVHQAPAVVAVEAPAAVAAEEDILPAVAVVIRSSRIIEFKFNLCTNTKCLRKPFFLIFRRKSGCPRHFYLSYFVVYYSSYISLYFPITRPVFDDLQSKKILHRIHTFRFRIDFFLVISQVFLQYRKFLFFESR